MSEAKERSQPLFSFDFNRTVKVRSEAQTITSNAGVLLLRELDHKLAAVETLARELHDPRNPERVRYSLTELLRERLCGIALGYSRQDVCSRTTLPSKQPYGTSPAHRSPTSASLRNQQLRAQSTSSPGGTIAKRFEPTSISLSCAINARAERTVRWLSALSTSTFPLVPLSLQRTFNNTVHMLGK